MGSLALVVSSLPCSNDDDEARIKALVDQEVCRALAQQGIQVARRTVAKYREAMHIQPANLRKSI